MIIFLNQDINTEELFSSKLVIPQEDFISYLEPKPYLKNNLLNNLNNKNEFYDLLSSVQLNNTVKKDSSKTGLCINVASVCGFSTDLPTSTSSVV